MAIVINGSGTITGLSAGGLPDSSIVNDDLAGSIADGKITGLSSSKLSGALPAIDGSSLTGIQTATVSTSDPAIDTNATLGTQWANSTSGEFFVCTDATTGENIWTNVGDGTGDIEPWTYGGSNYGYHMHGMGPWASSRDDIDKYSYSSDGNSTFVGDQVAFNGGFTHSGSQGTTHGYCIGGANWPPTSNLNRIEKVSFSADGNAVDAADLTVARHGQTGNTNGAKSYGYAAGGHNGSSTVNTIDKWSQVSDANATDVGDAISAAYHHGDWDSETYGYICGDSGSSNVIQKFSFSSDGNASDVADLTTGGPIEGTNDVNTAFASRGDGSIDKFSFSTEANATSSGFTLTTGRSAGGASSSLTHGYVTGGGYTNIISKYSFAATSGSDSDVGDLRFNAGDRCGGFQY